MRLGRGRQSNKQISYARDQGTTNDSRSWDFTIDIDVDISQSNDPLVSCTWNASWTAINDRGIGVEHVQDGADLYEDQLEVSVEFQLCVMKILREEHDMFMPCQFPWNSDTNAPESGDIPRCMPPLLCKDYKGSLGHRNCASNKYIGDPGQALYEVKKRRGFKPFDLNKNEDLVYWMGIQSMLGFTGKEVDGIPGKNTWNRMKQVGIDPALALIIEPRTQIIKHNNTDDPFRIK
jgi:hypothetical protein